MIKTAFPLLLLALLLETGCGDGGPPAGTEAKEADTPTAELDAHEAAQQGAVEMLRKLLANNPDAALATSARHGRTPLMAAAQAGQVETVQVLLDAGADINATNRSGTTPLQRAVQRNHEPVALLLLSQGAAYDVGTRHGETLLRSALTHGHDQVLTHLFKQGLDPSHKLGLAGMLNVAARAGQVDTVRLLLQWRCPINERGNSSESPLHAAAKGGHIDVTRLLLDRRADIEGGSRPGSTPLVAAIRSGHPDIAILLVNRGAAIKPVKHGPDLLHMAAGKDSRELAELLIRKGLDPRGRNAKQETPLHAAAAGGALQSVEALLMRRVEVDAVDRLDSTPLLHACEKNQVEAVKRLLAAGADPNRGNHLGATPLHYAALLNNPTLTRILLAHGASAAARLSKDAAVKTSMHGYVNPFDSGKSVAGQTPLDITDNDEVKRLLRGQANATRPAPVKPAREKTAAKPASGKAKPVPRTKTPPSRDETGSLVGKSLDEVKRILGRPRMRGKQGKKVILVYEDREISAADGVTVDSDSRR